ncbi:hypothetical protein [Streptomyces sp. CBMA152]|uniref:hypothetical protein n=1 Tax=Streptomyces sp. CBMA152 TaxID=1896312 RepID=UPI001660875C|nr:hypothetical protein [Streptomyces sp. CBMA152]MBD0741920.1 hypothetical protein [Streptomyces sp. CBMA152]
MTRSLPAPELVLGYRRDGRPIHPVLGASAEDSSNDEVQVTISQRQLNTLLAREKDQGGRAAVRQLVDKLGFSSTADLTGYLTAQRQAEQEQLSDLQRREQELAQREKTAVQREAQALARERAAARRAVLSGLGASGQDLEDAAALLGVAENADDAEATEAAEQLKARRPELFTPRLADEASPAAPAGSPASVPPYRPVPINRSPGAAGLEMARKRGLLPPA